MIIHFLGWNVKNQTVGHPFPTFPSTQSLGSASYNFSPSPGSRHRMHQVTKHLGQLCSTTRCLSGGCDGGPTGKWVEVHHERHMYFGDMYICIYIYTWYIGLMFWIRYTYTYIYMFVCGTIVILLYLFIYNFWNYYIYLYITIDEKYNPTLFLCRRRRILARSTKDFLGRNPSAVKSLVAER